MDATLSATTQTSPCGVSLPELEIPMINSIISCLGSEHRKFDNHILQLALAGSRLASDPEGVAVRQKAAELWDEIRRDLWSHLQIEDQLVFSWAESTQAIPSTLLNSLKVEHQAMRDLIAALPESAGGQEPLLRTTEERGAFARTLLTLAQTIDSHIERYEAEVLPLIRRALFHRPQPPSSRGAASHQSRAVTK
jgi:hemerythrin-like domain-containing protein